MFDLHKYSARLHAGPVPAPSVIAPVEGEVTHVSFLLWAEHCTECAVPACYRTCDLFEDRGDGHCRRFRYGVYRNEGFAGLHGYGAEISFKKWAKLDAVGNTRMEAIAGVRRHENSFGATARMVDGVGHLLFRVTGDHRWSRVAETLLTRRASRLQRRTAYPAVKPDAFLLRVYNPSDKLVELQLQMNVSAKTSGGGTRSFQAKCLVPPGYSRHEFPAHLFQFVSESGDLFYVSVTPAPETEPTLVFLTADFVKFQSPAAPAAPDVKCLLWDLDGTLWRGTLVEESEVRLRPEIPALLRALDERGILLSIISKNDHAAAWRKLEEFGIAGYFLAPQINWLPKSQNLRTVAAQLNIGIDTLAYIDDNPFELAEVSAACPQVRCFPVTALHMLLDNACFRGSSSEEASKRRRYYQDAAVREQKLAEAGGDYERFLASCDIRLEVSPYRPEDFERVAELVQRTNQLNFSGRHYSRAEISGILADTAREKLVLRCADRYGSYGTVGFSIVRRAAGEVVIEDFMLSCRVQAKCIEQAFFSSLQKASQSGGALPRLSVHFRQTDRNTPARQALASMGFSPNEASGMLLDGSAPLTCDFIHVQWEA
jgi:FkbH-like protein